METQTIEKTVTKPEMLCELRIERNAKGVSIWIQSAEIETFFASRCAGAQSMRETGYDLWSGPNGASYDGYYTTDVFRLIDGNEMFLGYRYWRHDRLCDAQSKPYLGFLMCKGLKDGITIEYTNVLLSNAMLENYTRALRAAIAAFYSNYIRQFIGRVTITYKEVISNG